MKWLMLNSQHKTKPRNLKSFFLGINKLSKRLTIDHKYHRLDFLEGFYLMQHQYQEIYFTNSWIRKRMEGKKWLDLRTYQNWRAVAERLKVEWLELAADCDGVNTKKYVSLIHLKENERKEVTKFEILPEP